MIIGFFSVFLNCQQNFVSLVQSRKTTFLVTLRSQVQMYYTWVKLEFSLDEVNVDLQFCSFS